MITVLGQNSAWQKTCTLDSLEPGGISRLSSIYWSAAGKGANVTRCLHNLGIPATLHGYTGGTNGTLFARACKTDGLNCQFVTIRDETRICTTLLEQSGTRAGIMSELIDPAPTVTQDERRTLQQQLHKHIESSDMLVIGGTALNGEHPLCYKQAVQHAHAHNVPCLLDSFTSHARHALEAGPAILKINQKECEELTGKALATPQSRQDICKHLQDLYNIHWIIITRGEHGIDGCNGQHFRTVRSTPVKPLNPIGSGDCASAGLLVGLLSGINPGKPNSSKPITNSRTIPWNDSQLLEQAMKHSAALGTANCQTLKPGHVDQSHYTAALKTCYFE